MSDTKKDSTANFALDLGFSDLPALVVADKIGKNSALWKFDWLESRQVVEKVMEEKLEVEEAIIEQDQAHIEEEIGDLLFATAQWARHLKIDPELALRKANQKYEKRFRKTLEVSELSPEKFRELSLEDKEKLWKKAKKALKAAVSY
jgi:uncharacterized protein YabN with tetrapyrrole methylase and pyrophosphatase domain